MTKRTEKLLSFALLAVNAAAMTVALTYAILTVRKCDRLTYSAQPVQYQTLNLLDFPQGRDALTPDPDPVSPAPVLEQWEDDPYIRAYQAGKYDAAEQYQEGDAEDYIPLDKAVFDLTQ